MNRKNILIIVASIAVCAIFGIIFLKTTSSYSIFQTKKIVTTSSEKNTVVDTSVSSMKSVVTGKLDDARVVSENIPMALATGSSQTLSIELKNSGTTTWSNANGYTLTSVGDGKIDIRTVQIPSGVAVRSGENYIFKFVMTAPSSAGAIKNAWQMSNGKNVFGDIASYTTEVEVRPTIDASTMNKKLLWGYQGWFLGPKDTERPWGNWFAGQVNDKNIPAFDYWPDVSELDTDELSDSGFTLPNGRPAYLYSNKNVKTVERQFKWMRDYGIDGVLVQRFIGAVSFPTGRALRDVVLQNVRSGAEKYGRVFANMYDLTGINGGEIGSIVIPDWQHLVDDIKITESSRYQRQDGDPVVALYGFPTAVGNEKVMYNGVSMSVGRAAALEAKKVLDFFHAKSRYRAKVFCSLPNANMTGSSWQVENPDWKPVVESCDMVGSWVVGNTMVSCGTVSVGHQGTNIKQQCTDGNVDWGNMDSFFTTNYLGTKERIGDLAAARKVGIDFMPHIYPGASTYYQDKKNQTSSNNFSRVGGEFLWRQMYDIMNVFQKVDGNNQKPIMIYGSMFDEFNEGTQIVKTAQRTAVDVPQNLNFIGFDVDPAFKPRSDYYMYLAGYASKMLRGEIVLTQKPPVMP